MMITTYLIKEFPNYKITKGGAIYNSHTGYKLKPMLKNQHRYYYVTLRKNGKRYSKNIHRLVLETFIGPCPDGMECCHNDGDASNNRLENLRWGTRSSNVKDMIKHGTYFTPFNTKLNEKIVRIIKILLKRKTLLQKEIAEVFNITRTMMYMIQIGKRWGGIK